MRRRTVLAGVVISIIDGAVVRAFADSEIPDGPAFEPWRTWQTDSSHGALALVRAAILAANAYNSQPWRFHVRENRIEIYADTARNLGAFDPYMREMHFSLGCALENLMVAAAPNGLKTSLTLFPGKLRAIPENPEPELVARIDLSNTRRASNELYESIPHRHTNRNPYNIAKQVPVAFQRTLAELPGDDQQVKVFLFTEDAMRHRIVDAIAGSSSQFLTDPEVQRGTRRWIRTSREQMDESRDGTLAAGPARTTSLDDYKNQMLAAPLFGLIAVRDRYDREQTIRAGRIWQRAHLSATAQGIAARPANGSVELIDHERRVNREPRSAATLAEFTGDASWQPTFMFYMGYAERAKASPRRPVEWTTI